MVAGIRSLTSNDLRVPAGATVTFLVSTRMRAVAIRERRGAPGPQAHHPTLAHGEARYASPAAMTKC